MVSPTFCRIIRCTHPKKGSPICNPWETPLCSLSSARAAKLYRIRNKRIKVSGNVKESKGKENEVVWACDVRRRALATYEGGRWKYKRRRKIERPKRIRSDVVSDDIRKKGLSGEEVYDCATWRLYRQTLSPLKNGSNIKKTYLYLYKFLSRFCHHQATF